METKGKGGGGKSGGRRSNNTPTKPGSGKSSSKGK